MSVGEFDNTPRNYLEQAMKPGGVLEAVASAAIERPTDLSSQEIADIIRPNLTREQMLPRWQLVSDARDVIKTAANGSQESILELAGHLGMRRETSISDQDLVRIQPDKAIWIIEGGANRTSVVRRELAIDAMRQVYGEDLSGQRVFQLGSDRQIPDPEYAIALEIGGDYLPDRDAVTEFEVGLASALASGYRLDTDNPFTGAERLITMHKDGYPELVLVMPNKTEKGGLDDGFNAVTDLLGGLEDRQLVIASNGHYRPKDEAQVERWAKAHNVNMLAPVCIGDEPGYVVSHSGREIVTPNRDVMSYLNEAIILYRIYAEQ